MVMLMDAPMKTMRPDLIVGFEGRVDVLSHMIEGVNGAWPDAYLSSLCLNNRCFLETVILGTIYREEVHESDMIGPDAVYWDAEYAAAVRLATRIPDVPDRKLSDLRIWDMFNDNADYETDSSCVKAEQFIMASEMVLLKDSERGRLKCTIELDVELLHKGIAEARKYIKEQGESQGE